MAKVQETKEERIARLKAELEEATGNKVRVYSGKPKKAKKEIDWKQVEEAKVEVLDFLQVKYPGITLHQVFIGKPKEVKNFNLTIDNDVFKIKNLGMLPRELKKALVANKYDASRTGLNKYVKDNPNSIQEV